MNSIKGIIPALVSPVDSQGKINKNMVRKLVNYTIKGGVHGLFAVGSTGEAYALSFEEKRDLFETVVDENNGRVPVYAGTGATTTRDSVRLSQMAEDVGANILSVLTPVFISPNEQELYEHYVEIAKSTKLPILLYSNPNRTGVKLSVRLVERLSHIENIVGIKDSSGDVSLAGEYIRAINNDQKEFSVIAGRDNVILATLVYGGAGAIASTANIAPALVVSIYDNYMKGDLKAALEAQDKLAPLRKALNLSTYPGAIKEAVSMIGIDCGDPIKPVGKLSSENRKIIYDIMKNLGLIK